MGIESSDELAEFLADQYLLDGQIDTIEDIIAKYQAVTRADIEALFPYLTVDQRWSYWIE